MKCLYCDKEISKESLYSIFIEDDELCPECRNQLKIQIRNFKVDDIEIETLFNYDSLFKSLLIQLKECYDESIKDVFLYKLRLYLFVKYFGYHVVFMPSSKLKKEERGFNHLELIFESIPFKKTKGLVYKQDLIQEGKNKKERELMIDNYIYEGEYHKKILLVDDVMTTGSSIKGASKVLKNKCQKYKVLCLGKRS